MPSRRERIKRIRQRLARAHIMRRCEKLALSAEAGENNEKKEKI